ncbi:MAG: DUF5320 domain-containing protein [Deltaproteobacteria bacterium]|nr:DUF5320 domain-containing protein [Deltaproteobacteria bacterium]
MPGFDGTGPRGEGPMTGGARGYCNPGYTGYGNYYGRGYGIGRGRWQGRGFGPGLGWGRGYGRGTGWQGAYYPPAGAWYGPTYNAPYGNPYYMKPEDEVVSLKNEAGAMKDELDAINKRIEELESQESKS